MQKPTTILISDFRKSMDEVLNSSGLPWWKVKDELEHTFLPQVRQLAIQEERIELELYNKALAEEESNKIEELREQRVKRSGKK